MLLLTPGASAENPFGVKVPAPVWLVLVMETVSDEEAALETDSVWVRVPEPTW